MLMFFTYTYNTYFDIVKTTGTVYFYSTNEVDRMRPCHLTTLAQMCCPEEVIGSADQRV